MTTIHRYLLKDVIVTMLVTVGVLTFVLVLGNLFARIFDLLINYDVPLWFVFEFVAVLIPFSLVFTLPWALLTSILLVFGRMSADSELVAVRASGISLSTFSAPILLLSVFCSIISLLMNTYVAPYAQFRMKTLIYDLARESPTAMFVDDAIVDQFPGKRIYVGEKVNEGEVLNLHVWELDAKGRPLKTFRAAKGTIASDESQNAILLTLYDARMEERDKNDPANLRLIQTGRRFEVLPIKIPLDGMFNQAMRRSGLSARDFTELLNTVTNGKDRSGDTEWSSWLTEIQKRIAASMSCITFALVAIPLAIRSHRRETSIGVLMSFGVVFLYYFLIIIAETFKTRMNWYPEVLIWLPNLIFQIFGLCAFLRVSRN